METSIAYKKRKKYAFLSRLWGILHGKQKDKTISETNQDYDEQEIRDLNCKLIEKDKRLKEIDLLRILYEHKWRIAMEDNLKKAAEISILSYNDIRKDVGKFDSSCEVTNKHSRQVVDVEIADESSNIVLFFHNFKDDNEQYNISQIKDWILATNRCVNICIDKMYSYELIDTINNLIETKKIQVRLITDMANREKIYKFSKSIQIKLLGCRDANKSFSFMNNNFCLRDDNNVMIGHYNMPSSALQNNFDNILITSCEDIVEQYIAEFEYLWQQGKSVDA